MLRSFFVEVSLLAFRFISVDLFQTEVGISLDRCPTRPFPLNCRLMETLELDVGINTNDDVVCEDTRHVAITVAPNPQLDILYQERSPVVMMSILRLHFLQTCSYLQIIMAWFMVVVVADVVAWSQ